MYGLENFCKLIIEMIDGKKFPLDYIIRGPRLLLDCYLQIMPFAYIQQQLQNLDNQDYVYMLEKFQEDSFMMAWNLTWKANGERVVEINSSHNFMEKNFAKAITVLPGQYLKSAARSIKTPKKNICIVATARNEGPYFLEWIAYHKYLGIHDFFIYSNDNDDGSNELLDVLAEKGIIYHIKNKSSIISSQWKAYHHAYLYNNWLEEYKYAFFPDIDEFLYLDHVQYANINEFIDFQQSCGSDCVRLNWIIAWANHKLFYEAPLDIERFEKIHINPHPTTKIISNMTKIFSNFIHYPQPLYKTSIKQTVADGSSYVPFVDKNGNPNQNQSSRPILSPAAVIHYQYKSFEEFIWKNSRNAGSGWTIPRGELDPRFKQEDIFDYYLSLFHVKEYQVLFDRNIYDNVLLELESLRSIPEIDKAARNMEAKRETLSTAYINRYLGYAAARPSFRDKVRNFLMKNEAADNPKFKIIFQ